MSRGGSQTSTSQSYPDWLAGPVQQYLGYAGDVAALPYQGYQGQRVADLAPTQSMAIGGLRDMANGGPLSNAAVDQVQNTLSGNNWNPFQQNVADRITNDAQRSFYQANNALMGRSINPANRNSSAFQNNQASLAERSARGLGDALAPVYQQSYENERGRQMQAVNQAQSLWGQHSQDLNNLLQAGDVERQQQQALLNSQYGDFMDWRGYPTQQLNTYGNALGAITGRAPITETRQGPSGDPISQGLGTIALGRYLGQGK